MRTRKDMASFPNVRPLSEPSVKPEGLCASAFRLVIAVRHIALALSELVTLQGTGAMRSTRELLTSVLEMPHPPVALVSVLANPRDPRGRWGA